MLDYKKQKEKYKAMDSIKKRVHLEQLIESVNDMFASTDNQIEAFDDVARHISRCFDVFDTEKRESKECRLVIFTLSDFQKIVLQSLLKKTGVWKSMALISNGIYE